MQRAIILFAVLATPLAAQDKDMLCTTSGEIVDAAVAERLGGADAGSARDHVADALPDDKAGFRPAVEPLVNWVYTLPPEQLTDEVASAYVEQCLAN